MYFLLRWWQTASILRGMLAGLFLGYAVTIRYTEGLLHSDRGRADLDGAIRCSRDALVARCPRWLVIGIARRSAVRPRAMSFARNVVAGVFDFRRADPCVRAMPALLERTLVDSWQPDQCDSVPG